MRTNWSVRIDEEAAVDPSDPPATTALVALICSSPKLRDQGARAVGIGCSRYDPEVSHDPTL